MERWQLVSLILQLSYYTRLASHIDLPDGYEEVAKSAVPADYVSSIFFTCYWRK